MPAVYAELCDVREKLEKHYKDMQDMEFTIEHGKLWMLQCRNGKRTAAAAVRMAVEMVEEGLLTKEEAILRVGADQLDHLLHPMLDPKAEKKIIQAMLEVLTRNFERATVDSLYKEFLQELKKKG